MTARVAINGFGRVGRLCLRSMLERHKDHFSVVALNAKQVGITMKEGEGTLVSARAVIDPGSPISSELTKSLREISVAARALRLLADYLERNPRALIFGKPELNNGE